VNFPSSIHLSREDKEFYPLSFALYHVGICHSSPLEYEIYKAQNWKQRNWASAC
jgi:hypothetical protein